jgi:hypothetical protein
MRHMDMNARLFPRKEEKPELTITKNCRRHTNTLHRTQWDLGAWVGKRGPLFENVDQWRRDKTQRWPGPDFCMLLIECPIIRQQRSVTSGDHRFSALA